MKKPVCILICCCSLLLFTACNDKAVTDEVIVESSTTEEVKENPIFLLTMDEVYHLTAEETEKLITENEPDWRTIYKIDSDYVMGPDDWLAVRDMLGYQLFGKEYLTYKPEPVTITDTKIYTEENDAEMESLYEKDPDLIYEMPTRSYILSLSDEEFIKYMDNLSKHWGYSAPGIDSPFSLLSKEELDEIRNGLLDTIGNEQPHTESSAEDTTRETSEIHVEEVYPD